MILGAGLHEAAAPTSIHHAAVHACLPHPDVDAADKGPKKRWSMTEQLLMALLCLSIVSLQIVAVYSNLFSILQRSCTSSAACPRGAFCQSVSYNGEVDYNVCADCNPFLTCTTQPLAFDKGADSAYVQTAPDWIPYRVDMVPPGYFDKPDGEFVYFFEGANEIAAATELCGGAAGGGASGGGGKVARKSDSGGGVQSLSGISRSILCAPRDPASPGETFMDEMLAEYWNENAIDSALKTCTACTENETGDKKTFVTWDQAVADNVKSMNFGDRVTYFFASVLLAYAIGSELEQIQMANLLTRHRRGHPAVKALFYLLSMLREFALLPLLMACVPTLTAYLGADSLSIIFNALAVLFVVDVDDFAFVTIHAPPRKRVTAYKRIRILSMIAPCSSAHLPIARIRPRCASRSDGYAVGAKAGRN